MTQKITIFTILALTLTHSAHAALQANEALRATNTINPNQLLQQYGFQTLDENPYAIHASNEYGITPLHCAASKGHTDMIDFLVTRGADINARSISGVTPLHYATRETNITETTMRLLIHYGADVIVSDKNGITPLHSIVYTVCTSNGDIGLMRLLLACGADVNAQNNWGLKPLHTAKCYNHTEAIALLRAYGATE